MSLEQNKLLIQQYNEEVIGKCNMDWFLRHSSPEFINHSAPAGMPAGRDGMVYFFSQILHAGFSGIEVSVKEMIAEGDKVATRKEIRAVHTGELMGIAPTGKEIRLSVIDIIAVKEGKITDHWGENNFGAVIQSLQS